MNRYRRLILIYTGVCVLLFIIVNYVYIRMGESSEGNNYYKVEINRALADTDTGTGQIPDISKFKTLINVEVLKKDASAEDVRKFYSLLNEHYIITESRGHIYKFIYNDVNIQEWTKIILCIIMAASMVMGYSLILYLYFLIVKPFNKLTTFPKELSRGNLINELPHQKNAMFKQFIWGLNMLKESLDKQKERELELQKEKQTLVLSISHDIKTPLSAIKLYSKALSENLYNDEKKKLEALDKIDAKADEISRSVDDIIRASTEKFINFTVDNGEFYLKDLVNKVSSFYSHRLETLHTIFNIGRYNNCLLTGDFDRMCEVIDNFLENAIKYGDGREIDISFLCEENCILMTVKNSGCTLDSDEVTHIFDCFRRGSNSNNIAGSGLGLYIARKLCLLMEGEVFARVENKYFYVTAVMRKVQ